MLRFGCDISDHIRRALLCVPILVGAAMCQQSTPHIAYVYPAGVQKGATVQVRLGGQYVADPRAAFVSGEGVQVKVLEYNRPLSGKEFLLLRDKIKQLLDKQRMAKDSQATSKPSWTDADEKELAELRRKLAHPPNRQISPALAEEVTLEVTADPKAVAGRRELRLLTRAGLTNPLVFCVGQLAEISEPSAVTRDTPAGGAKGRFANRLRRAAEARESESEDETQVTLPITVNGQMMPGDVDRYRFKSRKGTRLVVEAQARGLIPYLADAVPGWFQATLTLYDAWGKEVAYDDDFRFHPDPVLFYQLPRDGEYVLEVKDAISRGREDFVYRVTLGESPFITGIYPLGGPAGAPSPIDIRGWNLPQARLVENPKESGPCVVPISLRKGGVTSNVVPFRIDLFPECSEVEPNNGPDAAQKITLPVIVNGRVDRPGDVDVMQFDGTQGQRVVAEVYARRLDSPLDSVLRLADADGKQIAFNDDHEDKGDGLNTHHADSYLEATFPATGKFFLTLSDAQKKGGSEHAYRLRISAPVPDFALRIVPSSLTLRPSATALLTAFALRKDHFDGAIALELEDGPTELRLSGAKIPAGQDRVVFTVTAPVESSEEPVKLGWRGRAVVEGKPIVRPMIPCEDMMQAFAYRHLVPSEECVLAVTGRGMVRRPGRLIAASQVRIPAGGVTRVPLNMPPGLTGSKLHLELCEPPEGITLQADAARREMTVRADGVKAKAGLGGNLIVQVFPDEAAAKTNSKPQAGKRRSPVANLPAIPFEVVAK